MIKNQSPSINRLKKYVIKPLLILLAVLLALYVFIYIYITANKASIIKQVSAKISAKLNGDVSINNAGLDFFSHFPRISVLAEEVTIKDSMFAVHKHPFLHAKKLYLNMSLVGLLKKKNALTGITLEDAQLYLFTDTSGYTNRYLLRGKKDSINTSTASEPGIQKIKLNNVRLTQEDLRKEKKLDITMHDLVADVDTENGVMHFDVSLNALVHQLGFNLDKGSFLENKKLESDFIADFNLKENRLLVKDAPFDIEGQRFTIGADFQFEDGHGFVLDIDTKKLDMALGLKLLTKKLQTNIGQVMVDKPVNVHVNIAGPIGGGEPLVKANWVVTNSKVTTPFVVFTHASLTGAFTNEVKKGLPRFDPNSRIELHQFKGNWEGFDIRSNNIFIDNLETPVVSCDLHSDFALTTLSNFLQSNTVQLQQGTGSLNIQYKGPLLPNGTLSPVANGNIVIKNGLVQYIPRNVALKNVNTVIAFNSTDVAVKNMRFSVNQNDFVMNGSAAGLLTLIKSEPDKIVFDWNVFTPALDLGSFTGLLQPRHKRAAVKKAGGMSKISNQLDNMLEKGSVRLRMKANSLHYKRFDATNVNASISLVEDNWALNNVSLNHAGGNMNLSGTIKAISNLYHQVQVKSNLNNVDVKKIMYAFGNFGQTGIESENLTGKLNADVNVNMQLNRQLVKPSGLNGVVNFSLKNGSLINYEPLQKLQSFFKRRDFNHIYFAELKDRLDVSNKEIRINRMEIQSTVLSLFVEGVYSLEGKTDISIQVPLNNIKKRDSTYIPQNIGTDAKAGMSLYLRGRPGSDGKIKFSPDLFKKFRKD